MRIVLPIAESPVGAMPLGAKGRAPTEPSLLGFPAIYLRREGAISTEGKGKQSCGESCSNLGVCRQPIRALSDKFGHDSDAPSTPPSYPKKLQLRVKFPKTGRSQKTISEGGIVPSEQRRSGGVSIALEFFPEFRLAAVVERMFLILFCTLFFLMSFGINGIGLYYWYFFFDDKIEGS
ncbi:hypothetical protein GPALN_002245 [Globodera pallida]|nr:hypothetical protein GPALN_002245 [Globodera pallida]